MTWPEILEAYRLSEPVPDYGLITVVALFAMGLIVLGTSLTAVLGAGGIRGDLILIFAGVVFLLGSLWDVTVGAAWRKYKFLKETRRIFERAASAEQEFSFNEDGWKNQWKGEVRISNWNETVKAGELQNVFYVQTSENFVVVPTRVLSPKDTESLRRLALGEITHPFSFRVTLCEYVLTEISSLWRRSASSMITCGGLVLAFSLAFLTQSNDTLFQKLNYGIAAVAVILITISAPVWYYGMKYVTRPKVHNVEWKAEFSDRGMRIATLTAQEYGSWRLFTKFQETRRSFLVYIDDARYHILPKSCLRSGQESELKRMLAKELQQK
jgi:YcxB-like protein